MNLFFDLDGTLLDSRERLYQLFQNLVHESDLSFTQYWELKRNKVNHKMILSEQYGYSDEMIVAFEKNWMNKIELKEWLDLDKPFTRVTETLNSLQTDFKLYIVTARQSEEKTIAQIHKLGWQNLFNGLLVTKQKQNKYELIQNSVDISFSDYIIGDTGNDILTGKKLGIKTIAVLSGFMNRERLFEYNPDFIIKDITQIDKNKL